MWGNWENGCEIDGSETTYAVSIFHQGRHRLGRFEKEGNCKKRHMPHGHMASTSYDILISSSLIVRVLAVLRSLRAILFVVLLKLIFSPEME